MITTEH